MTTTAPGPWLLSRRADLLLFGGSTAASLLLLGVGAGAGWLHADLPPGLWLAFVVGVDVAHVWSTGWRVYADRAEFLSRAPLYLAIPAAAWGAGVVAHSISPALFWRLLAYAAVFHFVRQQYGWVALYRRKSGENGEPDGAATRWIDTAAIYAATCGPLLWWHSNLPRRFHWLLPGDFATGLPPAAGPVALAASTLLLGLWAAKEGLRLVRGRPVSWGKALVVATTALTWRLGIVTFDSDYAFTVTNVLVHGVPYLGLVLFTSRKRAEDRRAAGATASFADRASRSVPLFLAPLLLLAFAEEWGWDRFVWHDHPAFFPGPSVETGAFLLSLLVPLLALPQATHYLLDAWIWKVRPENAGAASAMGLEPARPGAAAGAGAGGAT